MLCIDGVQYNIQTSPYIDRSNPAGGVPLSQIETEVVTFCTMNRVNVVVGEYRI